MILSFVLANQTIEVDIEELNLSTSQVENVLFFGTGSGLSDLDPHSVYDFGSYDVVGQVVEGLFQNDLSDPDLKVIPCLALDHGTWDGNIYTVELKQGIVFHDGTPFDAYAVKFSFDRLQYFIDNDMVPTIELYRYYDYQTNQLEPIIKNVNAVSDYAVEFEIGVPQGIFESLLCAVSSSILSPSSTPEFDLIDTYNGDLIGTGPFTFEYFDPDVEVSLRAFDNYWKGRADIDHLVVKFYYDPYERASALENNEIHLARSIPNDYIDIFETNPNFIVDTVESTSAFYVGMNNYWIDKDVREAISYAIDYNYIIDDLLGGRASRLRSPIPEGIFYSDDTLNVAETDLIYARTIMQGLGHGIELEPDDDDAWGASTFLSYNFTYLPGHYMSENTFYLVQSSLARIGIEILDAASDWGIFLDSLSESSGYHREMIQMYWLGWGADYNDPSNYINNLFTNRTIAANGVHYNGYQSAIEAGRDPLDLMDNVQLLMEEALMETDTLLREQYYLRIQQLLVEEDRPWVYGYAPLTSAVYSSEIQGFQWNRMSFHRFYGVSGVPYEEPEPEPPTILIVGTDRGLTELDPLNTFGPYDVIDQVAEGLFGYDYSDPNLPIIPILAADYGTLDGNTYTVELKQGIEFHDGTVFDVDAVDFTFNRLRYFMDNGMAVAGGLYEYYDLETDEMKPIINTWNFLDEYTVQFELNTPYALFETLLAYEDSFMLSPTSTPLTEYIDTYSGVLVGTGPFVYEYYDPDYEVSLRAFENYWNGEPSIDYLKFRYIYDENERANQLSNGEIHMIIEPPTDRRGEFEGNPEFSMDSIDSTTMYYLGMNNEWIDRDLREAISYAFDYDYLLNEIYGGEGNLLKSPIPNGIMYADDSFNAPTTDIIYARYLMQQMGYGTGLELTDNDAWEASTFISINHTYNIGNDVRTQLQNSLHSSLGKIGIEVLDAGMSGGEYWNRLMEEDGLYREMLQLYWIGWGADYNDPSNYINNLYTNRTVIQISNIVGYNGYTAAIEAGKDPYSLMDNVQLLMEAAIIETDSAQREIYYSKIQELLVERDMPIIFGYVPLFEAWYSSEIQGFQVNSLGKLNFLGVSGFPYKEPEPEFPTFLILGTNQGLSELDPLNTYDLGSFDVIDQVAEGLFGYDYSDPNLPIIPQLAADYGTWDGNTYTVELKQGIEFHDGTPFDAQAVKFSFDRLQYFMDNDMVVAGELYRYYNPETDEMVPLINNVNIINDYNVEFELVAPYGLFETLLSFESSFILSPTSTPFTEYIDTYSGILVGTGPFVYEYYDPDVEVSFRAFDNYWNGRASIDYLKFRYLYDENERGDLLSRGEVHMIINPPTERRGEFEGNPDFVLDSIDSTTMYYLGMNNYWIDRDLREAISYAFDYDYVISIFRDGENSRLRSPIPNGILYADDSFNVPTTDLIRARDMMQHMGYGTELALDDDLAWKSSTFLSLNFTYNFDDNPEQESFRELLNVNLRESLDKIGIEVIDAGMDIGDFWNRLVEEEGLYREMLQLYWIGWRADYNDPSNYINTLFTNRTRRHNTVLYNGYETAIEAGRNPFNLQDNVQLLMEAAIIETNPETRELYYARIQQLLVEEDMPFVFGYVPLYEAWYKSEIQGFQMNSLGKLNFLGVSGFPYDTTPPVTEIYSDGMMGNDNWYLSDVLVTLDATDDLSGVYQTGYSFDEVEWILYTEPFLIEESKTIFYGSVDYSGNFETPNSIEINVDKTLPIAEVFLSGLIGMNDWYVSDVLVTLEATDDLSGVFVIGFSFDTVNWFPYIDPFLIEESKTIFFISIDKAGNYGEVNTIDVNIDNTQPTTEIFLSGTIGMDGWHISPVGVSLTAIDNLAGVQCIEYSLDSIIWVPYEGEFLIDTEGITTIFYRSIDKAGNIEIIKDIDIKIDKTQPDTQLEMNRYYVDPLGDIYITSSTEFKLTGSDSASGIEAIFYRINEGIWCEYSTVFTLDSNGLYTIEYYSVDRAGNEEFINSITVNLANFDVNSHLSEGEDNPITSFDIIFTRSKETGEYKLVATNPGQIFHITEFMNNWLTNIEALTIEVIIPNDFILKGSEPIHIYLDGIDVTSDCIFNGNLITIQNIPSGGAIKVVIHLDYKLKGMLYANIDDFGMIGYVFETLVSGINGVNGLEQFSQVSNTIITHQKKTTAIAGYVYNIYGEFLEGLTVELYQNGVLIGTTITDENGFFYFIDIAEGDYEVHVLYDDSSEIQVATASKNELEEVNFELSYDPL